MPIHWTQTWRLDDRAVLAGAGPVVEAGDVGGEPAWQELRRAGAVREVLPGIGVAAGQELAPALRAGVLGPLVPARTVVAGLSAAWVWGAVGPPPVVDLIYPRGGHRPPPDTRRRSRQAALLHSEQRELGGVRVTAPLRTVLDVATRVEEGQARAVVRALARRHGIDPDAAARSLELRYRWPGRARARAVLADC